MDDQLTDVEFEQVGRTPVFGGARADSFALPPEAPVCDIVMKGGVASGIVYPYAMLRVAQRYRLAGIGGTSAGAIAAALTAAAEYARQAKNDHQAYVRFEAKCLELPKRLGSLFQPSPALRPAFSVLTALMELADPGSRAPADRIRNLWRKAGAVARLLFSTANLFVLAFALLGGWIGAAPQFHFAGHGSLPQEIWALAWRYAPIGALFGELLILGFGGSIRLRRRAPILAFAGLLIAVVLGPIVGLPIPGPAGAAAVGGAFGAVVGAFLAGDLAFGRLKAQDFGMCPGVTQPGQKTPGLTDWLHGAVQAVAGRAAGEPPLTFGDIEAARPAPPFLQLRMITTNLTMGRPYALPDLRAGGPRLGWRPSEWDKLFPADVVAFLLAGDRDPDREKIRPLPDDPARLPVIVGARMSLSFPLLFQAVPVYALQQINWEEKAPAGRLARLLDRIDRRKTARQAQADAERGRKMLLIDGGISSNLPLHFFDNLGPPAHPTFAFSLEARRYPPDQDERVLLPKRPLSLPARPADTLLGYLSGLLSAAKDWQDSLTSIMPGHFDRIVRIRLGPGEGGLNLNMPPARSQTLMQRGYEAGNTFVTSFSIDEHRVRRALAAYQEIEHTARTFREGWERVGMTDVLNAAGAPWGVRRAWRRAKDEVVHRLSLIAHWSRELAPDIHDERDFPKPRGSLRITPNLSGNATPPRSDG